MKRLVYIFVGLLVVLVLLIAAIAILYFRGFLGGGECTFADDVDHVCAESIVHGCESHTCEEDCVYYVVPEGDKDSDDYYIPKPKAKIKIGLPSEVTSVFEDDIIIFSYSNSAVVEKKDNIYSIKYPSYNAEIGFFVKEMVDLDIEIYNFEKEITVHEKQGAYINANIIEDSESEMYGVLCYLEGNKIATSSQFFITDSTNYFVSGGLEFNTSINPEIEVQNNIMKQEVLKFINSFKWSSIPK